MHELIAHMIAATDRDIKRLAEVTAVPQWFITDERDLLDLIDENWNGGPSEAQDVH